MWKEFKEFAVKGNAIDLAVGVIIGAAFGLVIGSLVKDIIMPPIGLLTGGLDFSNQFLVLKAAPGGATFATPADAAKARDHLELRQLYHATDKLPHRRSRDLRHRQRGEQDEAPGANLGPGFKGVPGLCNDDSDQGGALSTLHNRTNANGRAVTL